MNFIKQNPGVIAVVALIIAITGLFTPVGQQTIQTAEQKILGGVTNYDTLEVTGLIVGTAVNPSPVTGMIIGSTSNAPLTSVTFGNCVIKGSITLTATTTTQIDCGGGFDGSTALTGITSSSNVFVNATSTFPLTPAGTGTGLLIKSVYASSTSGYITLNIWNGTGATYTWTGSASSSFKYLDIH